MRFPRSLFPIAIVVLPAAVFALDFDKPNPRAAGMNPEKLAQIRMRMQDYVDAGQVAGTVTIVARHGKVASFEAVGYMDIESKKPMRKDSMFRIASLTKPITCAGIMVLVDEGRLSVIDPVEKFLPEYKGIQVRGCQGRTAYACTGSTPARPMNIEDLMTHTSGLEGNTGESAGPKPATLAQLAALGAKTQLLFDPGTNWNYSNIGYNILGRIVEVVSGQPYEEFLSKRIFEPLGMKDTYFFVPAEKLPRLATLYTLSNGHLTADSGGANVNANTNTGPRVPHPAGGLVSTPEDILRFNLMMQNGGILDGRRVLSAAAVTLMTTSHTGDLKAGWVPGVGHGYGYEVVRSADGMFRYNSIGSFVKGGAYRTYEWVDPDKDLAGVFMTQLTNGGDTADPINTFMEISAAAIQ